MITATLYRDGVAPADIGIEELDKHYNAGGVLWVEMSRPSPDDLHHVAEEFSLHPLALESALQPGERAKVERYPTHVLVVVDDHHGAQLCLFIGKKWVISVTSGEQTWNADVTRRRYSQAHRMSFSPASLTYTVLDAIVDEYEDHVDALATDVELVEEQVLDRIDGTNDRAVAQDVLRLRRRLINLRRRAMPVRDVIQELRRGSSSGSFDDPEVDLGLADVADHAMRTIDQLDTQRELLSSAFDAHLATMSNQMNYVMRQLSAWGAIALAATLVAGIYGMNFRHMPELGWLFGYPFALAIMVGLGVGLYRRFKRRGWL